MKSDVLEITEKTDLDVVLSEVEKAADYNNLDKKNTLKLRLLAEELITMLPNILDVSSGKFWVENDDNKYQICVKVESDERWNIKRDEILELAKDGANAAYHGVMGKIRYAIETMFDSQYIGAGQENVFASDYIYESGMMLEPYSYSSAWSLQSFYDTVDEVNVSDGEDGPESWDELEKSIIANVADDVIVGIKGNQVDVIIKKEF